MKPRAGYKYMDTQMLIGLAMFHTFIVDLILIEDLTFFLSLKLWCCAWSHFMGPKPHKQMKNRLWRHF
jgi:hypothetical protein